MLAGAWQKTQETFMVSTAEEAEFGFVTGVPSNLDSNNNNGIQSGNLAAMKKQKVKDEKESGRWRDLEGEVFWIFGEEGMEEKKAF